MPPPMPEIRYLPSFQQDLGGIVEYITYILGAPGAVSNLLEHSTEGSPLNELEEAINDLKNFLFAHRLYRPVKLIPVEYRVLTVKNYLVFHIATEETIEIHRIVYKKRNLSQLVK
jgi:plasmid stabilization system protein ParE